MFAIAYKIVIYVTCFGRLWFYDLDTVQHGEHSYFVNYGITLSLIFGTLEGESNFVKQMEP